MKERIYLQGERIGEFEIVEPLAAGSCAAIYQARRLTVGPVAGCALKITWSPAAPTWEMLGGQASK